MPFLSFKNFQHVKSQCPVYKTHYKQDIFIQAESAQSIDNKNELP